MLSGAVIIDEEPEVRCGEVIWVAVSQSGGGQAGTIAFTRHAAMALSEKIRAGLSQVTVAEVLRCRKA